LGSLTDLETVLSHFGMIKEDKIPEIVDEEIISKIGELYQLGKHKLICGDAQNPKIWKKLMGGGNRAKIIFTSPPYNMGSNLYKNYSDDKKSQEYINFNIKVVKLAQRYLNGFIFWNLSYNKKTRWEFVEIFYKMIKETGLKFLELIVWDKGHGMPIASKEMLTRQYEDILLLGQEESVNKELELFYVGSNGERAWFNKKLNRGITNYWKVNVNNVQLDNIQACYPVKLPVIGMRLMSDKGDIIIDPFGGSGTTIIASEQMERICYTIEIDPRYCDVIRKRYANFIGKEKEWQEVTPKI